MSSPLHSIHPLTHPSNKTQESDEPFEPDNMLKPRHMRKRTCINLSLPSIEDATHFKILLFPWMWVKVRPY